ncbi:MAG TPA: dihydrofolate reductase family protein [Phototrophicaceae bacterium]|nr:dihydrofolate reductase family protein [Phototrophicaceae bacterium]
MRKLIASIFMTLDGFMADTSGDLGWSHSPPEQEQATGDLLDHADTILLGRVTYEIISAYWPFATDDEFLAAKMNTIPKVVLSKTLQQATWGKWNNATIAPGEIGAEVMKLKQQPGKDIVIIGSSKIVSALAQRGLIDDFRLLINPVALGNGVRLFDDLSTPVKLKLLSSLTYPGGVMETHYAPA